MLGIYAAVTRQTLEGKAQGEWYPEEALKGTLTMVGGEIVYGELRNLDRAFEYLDRAYAEDPGSLTYFRADPTGDSLKQDPRFAELMRKLGLE